MISLSALRTLSLTLALAVPLLVGTGCDLYTEHVCSEGEQPVYALDNANGAQCIEDGESAPEGFATYPPGRVPDEVGDRYDRWPLAEDYPWADEVSDEVRSAAQRGD